jgi:putative Mg2+ transporter-C (MgtC) family protein
MNWQQDALQALYVLLAGVLGGIVGWQREHMGIEAGVRTFAAVSLGACVFGLIYPADTRIAAQVVTGIGFLGAGVIMRGRGHIHGLTTAASLWAVASVGLAIA